MSKPMRTGATVPTRYLVKTVVLVAATTVFAVTQAIAHTMPWRAGMSRATGFAHSAKGPCQSRYDYRPSVPHVHLRANGRTKVVVCNGLQPDRACRSS